MSKLNGLYSRQVFWPEAIQAVVDHAMSKRYYIDATNHAKEKLNQLFLPRGLFKAVAYGEVIEAEFVDGLLVKIVTRLPHRTREADICSAILIEPEGRNGILRVKTIWTNRREDNHSTINEEAYVNG